MYTAQQALQVLRAMFTLNLLTESRKTGLCIDKCLFRPFSSHKRIIATTVGLLKSRDSYFLGGA